MALPIFESVDADTLAAEAVMLRAADNKSIFVLEGPTDYKLLYRFVDRGACDLIVARGKEMALKVIGLLRERGLSGILALVDADFDALTGLAAPRPDVVDTAVHDLECVVLQSSAFDRVVFELGSAAKINRLNQRGIGARDILLNAVCPLGLLRLYSIVKEENLTFEEIDFSFIRRGDMTCDVGAMVRTVYNKSSRANADKTAALEFIHDELENGHDPWIICCGHDLTEALGKALQSLIGTQRQLDVTREQIEVRLRLAFDAEDLKSTPIFGSLRNWEQTSGYTLLRAGI